MPTRNASWGASNTPGYYNSQTNYLTQQMAGMSPDNPLYQQADNQRTAAMMAAQAASIQQSNAAAMGASNSAIDQGRANRAEMFANARDRLNSVTNDPVDRLVQQQLTARATGQTNPYDRTTVNAYLTDQGNQAAQAERQQMAAIGRTGMQPTDPGYAAAAQEAAGRRQASLQNANLNINENANVANYQAQGTAIGQLNAADTLHQNMVNDSSRYLGGLLNDTVYRTHEGDISGQVGTGVGGGAQPIGGRGGYTNIYGQYSETSMPNTGVNGGKFGAEPTAGYSQTGQFQGYGNQMGSNQTSPLVGVRRTNPQYGYTYGAYNPNGQAR